jgi:two-component system sensor histidine kinase KdpD
MTPVIHDERDPEAYLRLLKREEERAVRGHLKIFIGMCAGVGKTYSMLLAGREMQAKKIDIVVGYVETHNRQETDMLARDLPTITRKVMEYRGRSCDEMDIDAVLKRKPALALVDELAHTNVPGSRHLKRYQDVLELLENGIDVYTTLNVQHIESQAEAVARIVGTDVRETVPDSVLDIADDIELVDIPVDELLHRLSEGKVYTTDQSRLAVEHFFRKGNLTALREMSLRVTAERVDRQLREYMQSKKIDGPWKTGHRLLVGIGASPHSADLIRWARRMASASNSTWVAVHVETPGTMSDEDNKRLTGNIHLASELGAEVVFTSDDSIAKALLRVARQQNASQILVGKSYGQLPWRGKHFVNELMKGSGTIDILVIGGDPVDRRKRSGVKLKSKHTHYMIAAGSIVGTVALCIPTIPLLGYYVPSLVLLLVVSVLSLFVGMGPMLLAAGLSAMSWDFFFIPPRYTFAIDRPEDLLMILAFFVIAIIGGVINARMRSQTLSVRRRERHSTALFELTRDLAVARSQDQVLTAGVNNLKKFFNADVTVFLGDLDGDMQHQPHSAATFSPSSSDFGVVSWVYWNNRRAGLGTDTLPTAEATYYPLSVPRYTLGVIGIRYIGETELAVDKDVLLENFIRQISLALDREFLNEMAAKAVLTSESDKLYSSLFNSLSHELRTPLSAISGAVEQMYTQDEELRASLIQEIQAAAVRLNRLVSNLLDMSRIESNHIIPRIDWCDVRDLIRAALSDLEVELANRNVDIVIPDEAPLIRADFGLVRQAICNIVHNACIYTPSDCAIAVAVSISASSCMIEISDSGPGIDPESLPRLFDKFYRGPGVHAGGTGLGLSIARGLIEVNGGTVTADNNAGGGARFSIRFPYRTTSIENDEQEQ